MTAESLTERDLQLLQFAIQAAKGSLLAGNIPIAALIADDKSLISIGLNGRVQRQSMILHAETAAIENAGRQMVERLRSATMYCTLSPCPMCAGAILLYRIPRLVIADRVTHAGQARLLRESGVAIVFADDEEAAAIMAEFIRSNPELWREDNGGIRRAEVDEQW